MVRTGVECPELDRVEGKGGDRYAGREKGGRIRALVAERRWSLRGWGPGGWKEGSAYKAGSVEGLWRWSSKD